MPLRLTQTIGIGRTRCYQLLMAGEIASVKVCGSARLERFVERLVAGEALAPLV